MFHVKYKLSNILIAAMKLFRQSGESGNRDFLVYYCSGDDSFNRKYPKN